MTIWDSIRAFGQAHRRFALAVLLCGFALLSVCIYLPSLGGGLVSDDWWYFGNAHVQELSPENVAELFDPHGNASRVTMNYAPVHLLAHAVQIEFFGTTLWKHHLVNVLVHSATAWLFVLLLVSSGASLLAASLAGLLFLVHPANVEAVAMLFQLKTLLSTALAFAALLLFGRHPLPALACFVLALLTKISAAFALPVAIVITWVRQDQEETPGRPSLWFAAWSVALLVIAFPEFVAFDRTGSAPDFILNPPMVQLRTIVAIGMRYLVTAVSGVGLSAYQQPPPAVSWLNAWWLLGLASGLLLLWRLSVVLRTRREEAAYWTMALASFAPVSQLFPFLFPMADRYLYGILPGLLGAGVLALQGGLQPIVGSQRPPSGEGRRFAGAESAVALGVALLALGFALQSRVRTGVFVTDLAMMQDAARNYPDGIQANLLRAAQAGVARDAETAALALRAAFRDGWVGFDHVLDKKSLAPIFGDPEVREVLRDMAAHWIRVRSQLEDPLQIDEFMLAKAHAVRGETELALAAASRALALGGPDDDALRQMIAQLEAALRVPERIAPPP